MATNIQDYLCPPGNGVFTVSTASSKKLGLHQYLYQCTEPQQVADQHHQLLLQFNQLAPSQVALLGICSDTGGGIQRGANWGPLYIRERLYRTQEASRLVDLGDVRVIPHLLHDKYLNPETIKRCQRALYGKVNSLPVSPLSIAEACLNELYQTKNNLRLLALGGDHSVSYPLVKTFLHHKHAQGKKVGLIHFDAHTDLLRERLGIDICFGSWLSHVLEYLDEPNHVVQFGIRASKQEKAYWQTQFGLKQYWASEINTRGITAIIDDTIKHFKQEGIEEIYISFDIDALDATIAGATGTPEPGGLSLEQALQAICAFSQAFKLSGADVVEVAPLIGDQHTRETTVETATQISQALIQGLTR